MGYIYIKINVFQLSLFYLLCSLEYNKCSPLNQFKYLKSGNKTH